MKKSILALILLASLSSGAYAHYFPGSDDLRGQMQNIFDATSNTFDSAFTGSDIYYDDVFYDASIDGNLSAVFDDFGNFLSGSFELNGSIPDLGIFGNQLIANGKVIAAVPVIESGIVQLLVPELYLVVAASNPLLALGDYAIWIPHVYNEIFTDPQDIFTTDWSAIEPGPTWQTIHFTDYALIHVPEPLPIFLYLVAVLSLLVAVKLRKMHSSTPDTVV